MTFRTHVTCRDAALVCMLVLAWACGGTNSRGPAGMGTETDNPSPGKPPKYESPADFDGDKPGMSPGPSGCVPPQSIGKPARLALWGHDGALLIGVYPYRGLMALDTSDPNAPQLRSTTPLSGEVHQLLVEPNAQVTLAIDEVPTGARDDVLSPDALQPVARLVRFDAGDARAVKRSAAIELEGEFWSMRVRGSTLWVMSEAVAEPLASCNRNPYDCGYVDRSALIVAGYQWGGGAFRRVARIELKSTGPAWELPDGYAAYEARDDGGDAAPGVLRFVRFDGDDALGQPGMVMLPGEVVPGAPIGLTDALVHVFTLDYQNGNSELDTISLDTGELLSKLDDLAQQQFDDSVFVGERLIINDENGNQTARIVDLSDPTAPQSQAFPNGVTRVVPLGDGTRALGLSPPAPDLLASLFSLQGAAPELLDQITVNQGTGAVSIGDVHVSGDHVVISYGASDQRAITVALAVAGSMLERSGEIDTGYADEVLIAGGTFYAPDWEGLRSGSLSGGDAQALSWSREVIDLVTTGAYRATLVRSGARAPLLELSRDGRSVGSLEVGPGAERLIADDEHVLVLSLESRDSCAQRGLDCSGYVPNVAIVKLGDTPAIQATVELDDPDARGPTAQGETQISWDIEGDVAFGLGQGHFVLVADYEATCSTEDDCAALGVTPRTANQALPDGVPEAPPCAPGATCPPPPPPAPAPTPAVTVFGEKHATRLYMLDASAAQPRFAAALDSVLELGNSRFGRARVSDGTLMITRIEREAVVGSAPASQPARFMLDRFVIEGDALHAEPPVNVPGLPIALGDEGALLFSAEPTATPGAGTLYMLALDGNAARTLDKLPLAASYSDALAAFGKIFYLRHDGTDCAGQSTLASFSAPGDRDGKLRALPEYELPGGRYHIADARDDRLLLTDDGGHYVVLDVSDDTPKLVKFLSATPLMRPRLQGDRLLGVAGSSTDELTFQ